jgi:uncharacterized protein (DUF305 family)
MKEMNTHYKHFAVELVVDALIMFFVMYSMVSTAGHVYLNSNNVYMTLSMVAPMGIVMLIAMRHMFPNKRLNLALYAVFTCVFFASFFATRSQALVGDKQFLRAMIPHHSGAILMCEQAQITDPEIKRLCREIVDGQKREIDQMEAILNR